MRLGLRIPDTSGTNVSGKGCELERGNNHDRPNGRGMGNDKVGDSGPRPSN